MMDKYAVVTTPQVPLCPRCGGPLTTATTVPHCPQCGTAPWEQKDRPTSKQPDRPPTGRR